MVSVAVCNPHPLPPTHLFWDCLFLRSVLCHSAIELWPWRPEMINLLKPLPVFEKTFILWTAQALIGMQRKRRLLSSPKPRGLSPRLLTPFLLRSALWMGTRLLLYREVPPANLENQTHVFFCFCFFWGVVVELLLLFARVKNTHTTG